MIQQIRLGLLVVALVIAQVVHAVQLRHLRDRLHELEKEVKKK